MEQTSRRNRVHRLLTCIGILLLVLGVLGCADWYLRAPARRVESLFSFSLDRTDSFVDEADQFSSSFLDGHYTAIVELCPSSMARLQVTSPSWQKLGWQKGRAHSLADRYQIPDDGSLIGISGKEEGFSRNATLRTSNRMLCLELRTQ